MWQNHDEARSERLIIIILIILIPSLDNRAPPCELVYVYHQKLKAFMSSLSVH
jgi:hypothetical protein